MAKIYGLFGSMTGKLADTVMSVRNGEQLARKYQPVVFNPSTPAQVATRAKLKLVSQLSAVMAPVIAIPRNGSQSSRNLFTKKNFGLATFSKDEASIVLSSVQLTSSVVGLPSVGAARTTSVITAYLESTTPIDPASISRVVYCMFEKQVDNKLRFVASRIATDAGQGNWPVEDFPLINSEVVILAYSVRDNSENARVAFGNLEAVTAEQVAKLVTTRALTEADVTLSETRGYTLVAAANPEMLHSTDRDTRSLKKK